MGIGRLTDWFSLSTAFVAGLAVVLCLTLPTGCSEKDKTVTSIQEAFSKGDFEEAMVQSEHALRRNIDSPEVYYYYGLALLAVGRDYESFRRLHEAVARDSALAERAAMRVFQAGTKSVESREKRRAAQRLKEAVAIDPSLNLGVYRFLVGDALFDERAFGEAIGMYEAAVAERPDSSAAESAYFKMAQCHVALVDTVRAIESLENLLEHFPKGEYAGRARYQLVNILYANAKSEFARGNYEAVVEGVEEVIDRTSNRALIQKARFLLGEAYERMADYPRAYEQYKAIIDEDRGASGRIVDRARNKINAFHDSGLL